MPLLIPLTEQSPVEATFPFEFAALIAIDVLSGDYLPAYLAEEVIGPVNRPALLTADVVGQFFDAAALAADVTSPIEGEAHLSADVEGAEGGTLAVIDLVESELR